MLGIRSALGSLVLFSSLTVIPAQAQQVVINELCTRPVSGAAAWIELRNVGQDYAALSGYALANEKGDRYVLPESTPPLAAGVCMGVMFDGQDRSDGNILHASVAGFMTAKAGAISLIDPTGIMVDSAGWGRGQPNEIKPAVGGRIATLPPGASLGRSDAAVAFDTIGWAAYELAATTIGSPNPPALIRDTHPLSGAIIEKQGTILSWFPMPGAAQYNVQLSSDPSFATLLADKTMNGPELNTGPLATGELYWRVGCVDAEGAQGPFSEPMALFVTADAPAAASPSGKDISVPSVSQHKDTMMLLLESNQQSGDHAWNDPHNVLDINDPADRMNCFVACAVMMNRKWGGDLSQDRLFFQFLKNSRPGPFQDLSWNDGISPSDERGVLSWALGTKIEREFPFWDTIKAEIDAGRPMIGIQDTHTWVISGYDILDGRKVLWAYDPWNPGSQQAKHYAFFMDTGPVGKPIEYVWVVNGAPKPVKDEPAVRDDADNDGIVDFDETPERFGTDPGNPDSDGDGVKDLKEVSAWMFYEGKMGMGYSRSHSEAIANLDEDNNRNEMDPHSDEKNDFGCLDGLEDENGNGKIDGQEIDPFDPADDDCIEGHGIQWNEDNKSTDRWVAYEIQLSARERNKKRPAIGSVTSYWLTCNERKWAWVYDLTMDEKTVKLAPRDPDWHWLCFEDETMPCTCGWTSWTVPCDAKWDKSGKAHDEHIETYKFTDGYIIWSHYEWDLKKPVK